MIINIATSNSYSVTLTKLVIQQTIVNFLKEMAERISISEVNIYLYLFILNMLCKYSSSKKLL